jgi:hypothetical protein
VSGAMEKGYRAVLVWEETKQALQKFRRALTDRELYQERRLVTAALEIVMQDPALRETWLARVMEINHREACLLIETTRRQDIEQ